MFGVNFKMIIFLPLTILAIGRSLKGKRNFAGLAFDLSIVTIFLGWVFLSQAYQWFTFEQGLTQYKDVFTTITGCWFVSVFIKNPGQEKAFIRVCLFSVAFSSVVKGVIFLYALAANVPVSSVIGSVSSLFDVTLMPMDLAANLGRVEFTSDTLVPICIFAILCIRKRLGIGNVVSLVIVILFLLSSFFTFSRVIWASTVLGAVLGLLVASKDRMHVVYVGITSLVVVYYYDLVSEIVLLRFSDAQAGSSDIERTTQNVALRRFFLDAPIFGHGLGSFSKDLIRTLKAPYSYESQIYALAGQIGVVGLALFVFLIFNFYRKAFTWKTGTHAYEFAVFLLLVSFLSSGFVNPTLLSSVSAASYGLIFVLASFAKYKRPNPVTHRDSIDRTVSFASA